MDDWFAPPSYAGHAHVRQGVTEHAQPALEDESRSKGMDECPVLGVAPLPRTRQRCLWRPIIAVPRITG